MSIINHSNNRGDTLIEVLFATAIFSLVAVGSLSIMNQGTATAQRAFEITMVRNEIDAQAETLRFLNASYIAAYQQGGSYSGPALEWSSMDAKIVNTSTSTFGASSSTCPSIPNGSFVLNARTAKFIDPSNSIKPGPATTFSRIIYDNDSTIAPAANVVTSADGIWIEAVKSVTSIQDDEEHAGYIDFHIRACWDSPGQSIPVTLGTIVRLYEPR